MKRYLGILAALACTTLSGPLLAQSQPKIIDDHMHYNGDPAFLQQALHKLESVDGMACLLVEPADMDTAVPFVHAHPDRFVGYAEINIDNPHVLEDIDLAHEEGFRGLGELEFSLKDYDDPSYWPIYERAEKYGMIILFHTGIVNREHPNVPENVSSYRMRPATLDLIVRKFPKLAVIGAHLGNPDYSWAGEIARWNPNLYFDVSGSSLIKLQNNYTFFKSIFWWSGVVSPHTPSSGTSAFEKLVFGSDVFGGDMAEFDNELKRYHDMLNACNVPEKAQENIFSGTMWKLLHREQ